MITVNPQSLIRTQNTSASFTVAATGPGDLFYQWWKDGAKLSGKTASTLSIAAVSASDAGHYWTVVTNYVGSITSQKAKLAVLEGGSSGTQLNPETSGKPPGKDSLVIVTHGWHPQETTPMPLSPPSWVGDMTNAIGTNLSARGLSNWDIQAFNWALASWTKLPDTALINGSVLGVLAGKIVGAQGWGNVHLIGHSAGAAVISAAAAQIKATAPATTVHTTFLDPYTGLLKAGRGSYGAGSDWSDDYFAKDRLTMAFTEGKLNFSHNVDVTWLDSEKLAVPRLCEILGAPPGGTSMYVCGYTAAYSVHDWPYRFYMRSVGNEFPAYAQYGFARSIEAGGWSGRFSYPVGNEPEVLADLSEPFASLPVNTETTSIPTGFLPVATGGSVLLGSSGVGLSTTSATPGPLSDGPVGTSAWVTFGITVTNPANAVLFDATFGSGVQAEGLLTVCWDTNEIGILDERVTGTNLQSCVFPLPFVESNGVYALRPSTTIIFPRQRQL